MTGCRFRCGGQVSPDRIAAGYTHCTRPSCIAQWREQRLSDAGIVLALMPKQGFQPVYKSEIKGTGRSSGRGT